jgi:hypothetical protein
MRRRDVLRSALARLLQHSLYRGWASWRDVLLRRKSALHLLRNAAAHIHLRAALQGMVRLRASVNARRQQRRALRHMMQRELACGWRSWQTARMERNRQHEVLGRALGRLVGRSLSCGWAGWHQALLDRAAALDTMRVAVRRLICQRMVRSLVQLRAHAGMRRQTRQALSWSARRGLSQGWHRMTEAGHASVSARRWHHIGCAHLMRVVTSTYLRSWQRTLIARRAGHHMLVITLRHKLQRRISLGWRAWRDAVASRKVLAKAIETFQQHLARHGLFLGWRAWCTAVTWVIAIGTSEQHSARHSLVMCLRSWDQLAAEMKAATGAVVSACRCWRKHALSQYWLKWQQKVAARRESVALAKQAFTVWHDRRVTMAMQYWCDFALWNLMNRAHTRLVHRKLMQSWRSWQAARYSGRRRCLGVCFLRWLERSDLLRCARL